MKSVIKLAIATTLLIFMVATHAEADTPIVQLRPSDDIYDMVANAPEVVIVDFYADWCGPCRKQSGILHGMQPLANKNRVSIIQVDVDQHQQLAKRFRVSSLPTLLVVKNGKIIERVTGVADHKTLSSFFER